jgi:hypothetical protein
MDRPGRTACVFAPENARTFDQFAALAEMGAAAGVEVTTELSPGLTVADLPTRAHLLQQ